MCLASKGRGWGWNLIKASGVVKLFLCLSEKEEKGKGARGFFFRGGGVCIALFFNPYLISEPPSVDQKTVVSIAGKQSTT